MPGTYRIEGDILYVTFEGHTPVDDVAIVIDAGLADPACPAAPLVLTDVTHSTSITSHKPEEMMRTVHMFGSRPRIRRIASVAPAPAQFGMMRMAEALSATHGVAFRVFSTPEEAKDWLLEPDEPSGP